MCALVAFTQTTRSLIGKDTLNLSRRIPDSTRNLAGIFQVYKGGRWVPQFSFPSTGGGSGTDSSAYRSMTQVNDTTIVFVRANGLKDTVVFSVGGSHVNIIAGTNVSISGIWPNITINSSAGSTGWDLRGNSINPTLDFFGTTSNHSIRFKTNNIIRAVLDSNGHFVFGTGTPNGDQVEVMSGHLRVMNRIKFGADGGGFTIEDRLIRSYGAVGFYDISQGADAFAIGATAVSAGPLCVAFTPLPTYLTFTKSGTSTYIKGLQGDYSFGQDFKIIIPDYHFGGGSTTIGNMYVSVGKNTTTNIKGKLILGHDGTTTTGDVLIMTAVNYDYADNAAALAAGLTVGTIYRTGDLLKIVH